MIIGILFILMGQVSSPAPADDQILKCEQAVHGNLATAVTACAASNTVDIFAAPSSSCPSALSAGVRAGKFGPGLPEPMRAGLVKDFDKRVAACRRPAEPQTQVRPVTQLWD